MGDVSDENKTPRLKQLIKVDVNRHVPLDKVKEYSKYIADEVFRTIPDGTTDIDVIVTLDFSSGTRKYLRNLLMDSLEDELLR